MKVKKNSEPNETKFATAMEAIRRLASSERTLRTPEGKAVEIETHGEQLQDGDLCIPLSAGSGMQWEISDGWEFVTTEHKNRSKSKWDSRISIRGEKIQVRKVVLNWSEIVGQLPSAEKLNFAQIVKDAISLRIANIGGGASEKEKARLIPELMHAHRFLETRQAAFAAERLFLEIWSAISGVKYKEFGKYRPMQFARKFAEIRHVLIAVRDNTPPLDDITPDDTFRPDEAETHSIVSIIRHFMRNRSKAEYDAVIAYVETLHDDIYKNSYEDGHNRDALAWLGEYLRNSSIPRQKKIDMVQRELERYEFLFDGLPEQDRKNYRKGTVKNSVQLFQGSTITFEGRQFSYDEYVVLLTLLEDQHKKQADELAGNIPTTAPTVSQPERPLWRGTTIDLARQQRSAYPDMARMELSRLTLQMYSVRDKQGNEYPPSEFANFIGKVDNPNSTVKKL